MSKKKDSRKMIVIENKNKVISCSTPEHKANSPSRDSDSEAASPVPFLCTQDGAEGETDVVWNYYTPKSDQTTKSRFKNSTPLSRKDRKSFKLVNDPPLPKRRVLRPPQKNTELFQDLIELNKNLKSMIREKKSIVKEKNQSGSEDDLFNESIEYSPKSSSRINSHCLRKNLLCSKFSKPDTEPGIESDDSMNECLIKASQVVEENIFSQITPEKKISNTTTESSKTPVNFVMGHDSMDAIISSIKLDSPFICKVKNTASSCFNNDSFDNLVGNLNDSALEKLTHMPSKNVTPNRSLPKSKGVWMVQEVTIHDVSPSTKSIFSRHNSMPESPTVSDLNKPSTSGMVFGRYSSMPSGKKDVEIGTGDSPIRCTPDEIRKKHQQAREKLLAKRQLPFTATQHDLVTQQSQQVPKKKFQLRVPSAASHNLQNNSVPPSFANNTNHNKSSIDIKVIIEKKRQEALMKLRRRQPK